MNDGSQPRIDQKPGETLQVDIGLYLKLGTLGRNDGDEGWAHIGYEQAGSRVHAPRAEEEIQR